MDDERKHLEELKNYALDKCAFIKENDTIFYVGATFGGQIHYSLQGKAYNLACSLAEAMLQKPQLYNVLKEAIHMYENIDGNISLNLEE